MDSIKLLQIIENEKLDSHEKIILIHLANENKGNGAPLVWSQLQKKTGIGAKKVKDYVEKLIQNELIVVVTERSRKKIVEVNLDFLGKTDFTLTKLIKTETKKESNPDLGIIWTHAKSLNFPNQGDPQTNRRFAYLLYRREGRDNTIDLITKAVEVRNDKYAPNINDFSKLYYKAGDLRTYYARKFEEELQNKIDNQILDI